MKQSEGRPNAEGRSRLGPRNLEPPEKPQSRFEAMKISNFYIHTLNEALKQKLVLKC